MYDILKRLIENASDDACDNNKKALRKLVERVEWEDKCKDLSIDERAKRYAEREADEAANFGVEMDDMQKDNLREMYREIAEYQKRIDDAKRDAEQNSVPNGAKSKHLYVISLMDDSEVPNIYECTAYECEFERANGIVAATKCVWKTRSGETKSYVIYRKLDEFFSEIPLSFNTDTLIFCKSRGDAVETMKGVYEMRLSRMESTRGSLQSKVNEIREDMENIKRLQKKFMEREGLTV